MILTREEYMKVCLANDWLPKEYLSDLCLRQADYHYSLMKKYIEMAKATDYDEAKKEYGRFYRNHDEKRVTWMMWALELAEKIATDEKYKNWNDREYARGMKELEMVTKRPDQMSKRIDFLTSKGPSLIERIKEHMLNGTDI